MMVMESAIIAIIKIFRTEQCLLLYSIYDEITYDRINISEMCNENIIMEKYLLELSTKNNTIIEFLLNQNINVFNREEPFFTDICFHFDTINKKDVPLKDRIKE